MKNVSKTYTVTYTVCMVAFVCLELLIGRHPTHVSKMKVRMARKG